MRILKTIILATAVITLAACKKKEESRTIIVPKPVKEVRNDTLKMEGFKYNENIEWNGKEYAVSIERKADTSLPLAKDESGRKYYDNTISLCVKRQDGSTLYQRTFHKDVFSGYVNKTDMHDYALLGLVVDEATDKTLNFAASVGSPDTMSDNYIPFVISIRCDGSTSIAKDTRME